jgi:hypothetical protein
MYVCWVTAVVPINLIVTNVVFTRSANSTVPLIPATSFELHSLLFYLLTHFGQYRLEQQEKLN